ncbi:MAG: hypothetical protein R2822_16100 [Spirosomataceae bacterium]
MSEIACTVGALPPSPSKSFHWKVCDVVAPLSVNFSCMVVMSSFSSSGAGSSFYNRLKWLQASVEVLIRGGVLVFH